MATAKVEPQRRQSRADTTPSGPTHDEIAVLAYSLWQARGCPEGTPEEDWFVAERSLKEKAQLATQYRP
jgi:Protein of unknown function (DUF2934)